MGRGDVKVAYFDLGLTDESLRLAERNRRVLEQFVSIAEARYGVGQSTQADVLRTQTQVSKMLEGVLPPPRVARRAVRSTLHCIGRKRW